MIIIFKDIMSFIRVLKDFSYFNPLSLSYMLDNQTSPFIPLYDYLRLCDYTLARMKFFNIELNTLYYQLT